MANLQTYGNIYYDYNQVLKMYLGNTCVYSKTGYPDDYVDDGKLWVYYNVTTTESDTQILHRNVNASYKRTFIYMEVDDGTGMDLSNSSTNSVINYRFSSTGEHLVKFTLNTGITDPYACFRNSAQPVKRIYFPSTITSLTKAFYYDCGTATGMYHLDSITTLGSQSNPTFQISGNSTVMIAPLKFPGLTSVRTDTAIISGGMPNLLDLGSLTTLWTRTGSANGTSNMNKIVIPATVTNMNNYFCWRTYNLKCVICKPTTPPTLGSDAFNGLNNYAFKIYVPKNSVDAYKAATNWSTWASKIEAIPDDYAY